MRVQLIAYGVKHAPHPAGLNLKYDLRQALQNPHRRKELRYLTGFDKSVQDDVKGSKGYDELVARIVEDVIKRHTQVEMPTVVVGVHCTGGKHRSVVVALDVGERLIQRGYEVETIIRDREQWHQ